MNKTKQLELFDKDVHDKDLSSIDRLYRDVKIYSNSSEFKKKLNFYCKFPYLGVYNSALVEQQRPGARLVLTTKKWKELYNRKIKSNARPVIILMPFYPVDFLFDIADTKPIDSKLKTDDDVIEHIINQYRAESKNDIDYYYNNMMKNLPRQGVFYDRYTTGSELQAEIRICTSEKLKIQIDKDNEVIHHSYFSVNVSNRASRAEELASLFHELAHLYCQHIPCSWWKGRFYTKETKEFEAETVSYLVCQRLGIKTNSVEYLSYYVKDEQLPPILIDFIFQAVDIIERMARDNMSAKTCLLYKKDKDYKDNVDKIIEEKKEKKSKITSTIQHL